MIRIVISDDHELIREGIKKIIRASKDMRILGAAADMAETSQLVAQHAPDIVILDISLLGQDDLEGLTVLRQQFPNVPILILSMYPEERFAIRALNIGASGYITKTMAAEELIKAIRKIMSGGTYISPHLAVILACNLPEPANAGPHEALTDRELQVIPMLGSGKQVKQIAAELSISISTVIRTGRAYSRRRD
ncbi:response regulator transcription factor [Noviherbaspirillum sp. Root189]|uniref:response regulator transcription factor n=1 Tax=Noviherbaspirillum sp. Root189 TaxID=1736487 RepID=UPI00070F3577|nr:response regulator transcription factor [Noviherbaspirillum sp. Root189]KRB75764.1 hypothetical protein ASE07_26515 [Noviherbaspirillum sp. Root189]